MKTKFLSIALFCSFVISAFADELVDAINQSGYPEMNEWYAADVGWEYTPAFSYTLTDVFTKFGYVDNRTVTVEVFDGLPSNGGILLRSAEFTPANLAYSGASFAPLNLAAGHSYFIGFRNVSGLDVNVSYNPDLTDFLLYYSFADDGSYSIVTSGDAPILEFYGQESPSEAVDQLISTVDALNINKVRKIMLTSILSQVGNALARNNVTLAKNLLKAFQNQVRLQIGRSDSAAANLFIESAQEIIDAVGQQQNRRIVFRF